jgi:hypothetical protein
MDMRSESDKEKGVNVLPSNRRYYESFQVLVDFKRNWGKDYEVMLALIDQRERRLAEIGVPVGENPSRYEYMNRLKYSEAFFDSVFLRLGPGFSC